MKNILSNSAFRALHESKPFTSKKCNPCEKNGDSGAKIDPILNTEIFTSIVVHEARRLPQREILIIKVIFQALSNGAFKSKVKGVEQGQKLRILLNSIKSL